MRVGACVLLVAVAVPLLLSWLGDGVVRAWFFPRFSVSQIPPLDGQVALVTGPTLGGIGHYTALELARNGAHVVLAGRSAARAEECMAAIRSEAPRAAVSFLRIDLASLATVREAASEFQRRHRRLDMLVLNAGVMTTPFTLSADGYELQFAVNHLGHFLLTYLLADTLAASAPARVAVVSSGAHYLHDALGDAALPFAERAHVGKEGAGAYGPWAAYARSKLCNVLFAEELAARLGPAAGVYVNALHPGGVHTGLQRHMWAAARASVGERAAAAMEAALNPLLMSPRQGAVTQLYLVASPEVPAKRLTGLYWHPQARRMRPAASVTPDNRARLWALSMQLTAPYRSWFAPSSSRW